jgi:hypothetical protein
VNVRQEDERLAGIGLESVTMYLGGAGWKRRAEFPRADVVVFDGPVDDDGEPLTVVLPRDDGARDYRLRLGELLRTLAVVEARPPDEIAADLRNPGADRLLARIVSASSSAGSIPLSFAATLMGSLRELVVAAACAEEEPRPFYAKATKSGTEHGTLWRMGQTQVGSFVVPIECAVVPAVGRQGNLPNAPPLSRRVATRIMRGLGAVEHAVLDGEAGGLTARFTDGLNANMCEALLALQPTGADLALELSAHWSPRLAAPEGVPRRVRVETQGFDLLKGTAQALRAPAGAIEREFVGEVVRLGRDHDDGVAVIEFDEGGRTMRADVHLARLEYAIACDAHRDGRSVRVAGRLGAVSAKKWRIFSPSGFQPAEPAAATRPGGLRRRAHGRAR